jgi:hypothetical protein
MQIRYDTIRFKQETFEFCVTHIKVSQKNANNTVDVTSSMHTGAILKP